MKRNRWLPTIIGGGKLKKGMIVAKRDLLVVWLKREFKSGESFSKEDVDKIDIALHFTNRDCVKMMIDCLQTMYDKWED